jgi:hypothetical protein
VEVEQVGLAMRMRGNRLLISFRACWGWAPPPPMGSAAPSSKATVRTCPSDAEASSFSSYSVPSGKMSLAMCRSPCSNASRSAGRPCPWTRRRRGEEHHQLPTSRGWPCCSCKGDLHEVNVLQLLAWVGDNHQQFFCKFEPSRYALTGKRLGSAHTNCPLTTVCFSCHSFLAWPSLLCDLE